MEEYGCKTGRIVERLQLGLSRLLIFSEARYTITGE